MRMGVRTPPKSRRVDLKTLHVLHWKAKEVGFRICSKMTSSCLPKDIKFKMIVDVVEIAKSLLSSLSQWFGQARRLVTGFHRVQNHNEACAHAHAFATTQQKPLHLRVQSSPCEPVSSTSRLRSEPLLTLEAFRADHTIAH